jgi:hypothetical protein
MSKNYENLPFEFLFRINGKPIVGRNFSIKGFNTESLRSLELKECIDDVVEMIETQFKEKSKDLMWNYFNPYELQSIEDVNPEKKGNFDEEDVFTFEIISHGKVVAIKSFSGNFYQPKVRYDVNVRDIISKIIIKIQETLSSKNLTKQYSTVTL